MGMSTLSWCKDVAFKNADKAIEKLYSGTRSIVLYHSNIRKLEQEIEKLYDEIKSRNSKIDDIEQQMLPTNPYYWADIDGCLAVTCAEIGMNTFKVNAESMALFTGYNYSVITDPDARKPLSSKAMASMAMIGAMVTGRM